MSDNEAPKRFQGRWTVLPGQPLQISERIPVSDSEPPMSPLVDAMAATLKAYRKAAWELLDGQFANVRELAPPHLRTPCHIHVIACPDGVLVRYDAAGEEEPKVHYTDHHEMLEEMAPNFSEHVIHVPNNPATYVAKHTGPGFVQLITNNDGQAIEYARIHPVIYAPTSFPADVKLPAPPERPPCLASLHRELYIQFGGVVSPTNVTPGAIPAGSDHFIAYGIVPLPVGWQAIEIYPRLGEEYWRPEYARAWARLDLLSAIAQRNAVQSALQRLDGRRAAREYYAKLLDEFQALLEGPEEPCHQFLKAHPDLLCPTRDAYWSKLQFGAHVSDFVFRESHNDYLLVEIEAPHRELFRRNGHPRHQLTHAIGQIDDWLGYIQDNKAKIERELGLVGISATPRTLVVIGRSASLTEENRRTLTVMQSQRLSIMTYDDLIDRARANLEQLFGPLSLRAQNLEVYFYRSDVLK
jgi:Domain of unknown function (DUF4263)